MNARNGVVLCTDRNMLVPAAFVATRILEHSREAHRTFDVIIVTDEASVRPEEKAWLSRQGIEHKVVDFTDLRKIFDTSDRLTTATLVKLILPDLFADRFDRILYLEAGHVSGLGTFDELLVTHAGFARLVELGSLKDTF